MLTLLQPVLAAIGRDDDLECIACHCRPHLTLCGRYDASELVDEDIVRERCCPACYEIWIQDLPCPNCGCRWGDTCRLCEANL
jgi:hypothetical protein